MEFHLEGEIDLGGVYNVVEFVNAHYVEKTGQLFVRKGSNKREVRNKKSTNRIFDYLKNNKGTSWSVNWAKLKFLDKELKQLERQKDFKKSNLHEIDLKKVMSPEGFLINPYRFSWYWKLEKWRWQKCLGMILSTFFLLFMTPCTLISPLFKSI